MAENVTDNRADIIDLKLEQDKQDREFGKECPVCKKQYSRRKQKCLDCLGTPSLVPIKRQTDDEAPPRKKSRLSVTRVEIGVRGMTSTSPTAGSPDELYGHIPSNHPPENVRVKARDPVFVNPNSFLTVIKVLQCIGKDLAISKYVPVSTRKWAVVVCDGLPYSLCHKILAKTYRCKECHDAIYTEDAYKKHLANIHNINNDDNPILEFDWVLARIGYGHYEMNMVSTLYLNLIYN